MLPLTVVFCLCHAGGSYAGGEGLVLVAHRLSPPLSWPSLELGRVVPF